MDESIDSTIREGTGDLSSNRVASGSNGSGEIALDIETMNLDMKSEGLSFDNPKGWTTSCVCIYDPTKSADLRNHRYGDTNRLPAHIVSDLNIKSWKQLKNDLASWFDKGYTLITKNGRQFDLPIISKGIRYGGCGVRKEIQQFENSHRHLDLQVYLEEVTDGIRFSLQSLISAILGPKESKLMAAEMAPLLWEAGDYLSVYEYCDYDARYTYEVWAKAKSLGSLQAIGYKEGIKQNCYVRIKW